MLCNATASDNDDKETTYLQFTRLHISATTVDLVILVMTTC